MSTPAISSAEAHSAAYREASVTETERLREEVARLRAAIGEHHGQRADDRCWEDDDRLYAAAGLPLCDRRVGNKDDMLANCRLFVERRCEGGGPWVSYRELEAQVSRLRADAVIVADLMTQDCDRIRRMRAAATALLAKMDRFPMSAAVFRREADGLMEAVALSDSVLILR